MSIPPIKRPIVMHFRGSDDELKDILNKLGIEIKPKYYRSRMILTLCKLLKEGLITGDLYGDLPCRSFECLSIVNSRIVKWQAAMEYMTEKQRVFSLRVSRISEPNRPAAALLSNNELQPWQ